jgi:hypothetical protein
VTLAILQLPKSWPETSLTWKATIFIDRTCRPPVGGLVCITFLRQDVILNGYRIEFSSRKQLDRQKKKEKRQSPPISDHLPKKQMIGGEARGEE